MSAKGFRVLVHREFENLKTKHKYSEKYVTYDGQTVHEINSHNAIRFVVRDASEGDALCADGVHKGLATAFGSRYGHVRVGYGVDGNKKAILYSNSLPGALARIALALYSDAYGADMAVEVDMHFKNGRSLRVETSFNIGPRSPVAFKDTPVVSLLDTSEKPYCVSEVPVTRSTTPNPEWKPNVDREEIDGDLASTKSSVFTEEDVMMPLDADKYLALGSSSEVFDSYLTGGTSAREKYRALAHCVLTLKDPGPVLVVGDNPGTLANDLLNAGVDVYGIDPKNVNSEMKSGFGRNVYRMIKGSAVLDKDPTWLVPGVKFAAAIVDTSDNENAKLDTTRNANIAAILHKKINVVIFQSRSSNFPNGKFVLLDLPGHSSQGAEGYFLHVDGRKHDVKELAFAVVNASSTDVKVRVRTQHDYFDAYFLKNTEHEYLVARENWYCFMLGRAYASARDRSDHSFIESTIRKRLPLVELVAALSRLHGVDDPEVQKALDNKFGPRTAVRVAGLPRGALEANPRLKEVMRARYLGLLEMCAISSGDPVPLQVQALFSKPGSGILLRELSKLRNATGNEMEFAKYQRVLPYEAMSILSSVTIFKLVGQYLFALSTIVNKRMHSWELQFLLWSLSSFGTWDEKVTYLGYVLRRAALNGNVSRRAVEESVHERNAPVRTLLSNLEALKFRELYCQYDKVFSSFVAVNNLSTYANSDRKPKLRGGTLRVASRKLSGMSAFSVPDVVDFDEEQYPYGTDL